MKEGGQCRTVAIHSYKGGTGKTQISVNLALLWAMKGLNVCLLDYDFRAPSIGTLFGIDDTPFWINDYLAGSCEIEQALTDVSTRLHLGGKLLLGLANPSIKAAGEMIGQNERAQLKSLRRTIEAQKVLEKSGIDHIVIDTSPGPHYSSLNAIFASNVLLIVLKRDKVDISGTVRMLEEVYRASPGEKRMLVNMVPPWLDTDQVKEELEAKLMLPLIGVISCYCDFAITGGESLFALERPNHGFVEALRKISEENIFQIDRSKT
jgi:MinD-like ATPase involved in chromosome partitioning or flagellar assembly